MLQDTGVWWYNYVWRRDDIMPDVFWAAFAGAAAAGLITLVAVIIAEWFRWFLDRPLVKVEMTLGFLLTADGKRDESRQVFLEASNPHTKPVTLSTFGLIYKREKWGKLLITPQFGYQFPYHLDGGKSLSQWSLMQELLKTLKKQGRIPRDLKWAWFKASSGRLYRGKIKKWVIEELEKEFQKMNENSAPSPTLSPE
jgi:hypothetical protein